ncbi:MAG: tricarboxylate binding receptor [Betaproteobacteria bacterium]|nr:tricarboxylate binding receptor [Betaproteobacteria bacterium]
MKSLIAAIALAISGIAPPTFAQVYPSHPITIVVPFAAGGPTDVIARTMAQHMRASLGQSVIVENVTGANGNIGVGKVARAAPDGYTISIGHWSTHVVNGAVYPLPYDLLKDFEPVSLIATNSYLIVAKNAVPAGDLKSFIAWLKANPNKASEGTAGAGSPQHVSGVFFQNATGTRFQFVPYRGAAPAMQDLMAGEIDMIIDDPTSSLPQVRAGRIKAFAVTAKSRLAAAPDIPSVDEAGLPGFYFSRWHALWVPRGTPKEVISTLNAAVVGALADPTVRSRLADLGQEIFPREQQTPAVLGAYHKAEIEKWWPIIKAAGIKVE